MSTIESRLAALEKLYADKSLELATCRLDVAVLQDLFIIWQRIVTGEDASALEGLVEKMLPSEPASAAARQLLGLPVKEVRMQEEPDANIYGPADYEKAKQHIGKLGYFSDGGNETTEPTRLLHVVESNYPYATENGYWFAQFKLAEQQAVEPTEPEPTDDTDPFPNHPKRGTSVNFKIEVMATVVAREPDHIWVTVPGEEGGPDRLQKWEWSKTHRGPTLSQLSHLLEADADPT